MARAGTIEVDIRANSAQFVRSMQEVGRGVTRVDNRLQTFARNFNRVFVAGIAAAGVRALNMWQVELGNTARSLDDFAGRINVTAEELQAFQNIAERGGVSTNQFNMAMQRLTRRAQEAAMGTGEARDALARLGIDAERFVRLSLADRLRDLATVLNDSDNATRRLSSGFKLLDSEGTVVLDVLKDLDFEAAKEEQVWSEETRENLAETTKAFEELGQKLEFLSGELAAASGWSFIVDGLNLIADGAISAKDGVEDLSEAFTEWLNLLRSGGRQTGERTLPPEGTGGPETSVVAPTLGPGILTGLQGIIDANLAASGTFAEQIREGVGAGQTAAYERRIAEARDAIAELEEEEEAYTQFLNEQDLQRLQDANNAIEEQKALREATLQQFENLFAQNLVQAADGSFREILNSWILTIQQMVAVAAASRIFGAIGGTGFGQAVGNFFGGARANGGPVMAGNAYLVGERGPELFAPSQNGQIVPNNALGGTIVQNITVNGGNRGELLAAMTVAKNAAVREVEDARRRS